MDNVTFFDKLKSLMKVIAYCLLVLFTIFCVQVCMCLVLKTKEISSNAAVFSTILGYLIAIYLLKKIGRKSNKDISQSAFWKPEQLTFSKILILFLAGFGFGLFVAGLLSVLPLPQETSAEYARQTSSVIKGNGWEFFVSAFMAIIFAPFAEEFIHRGFIMSELLEKFSPAVSAVIGSLIFGAGHNQIYSMIYAFVMGLLFSAIVIRYKNITYTMMMHIGFNSTSVLIMALNNSVVLSKWSLAAFSAGGLILGCLLILIFYKRERV